jgi:hypothetical protein
MSDTEKINAKLDNWQKKLLGYANGPLVDIICKQDAALKIAVEKLNKINSGTAWDNHLRTAKKGLRAIAEALEGKP